MKKINKKEEEIVSMVLEDFKKRQQERKPFETQWQLNLNFLLGNQYCEIAQSEIQNEVEKRYYWQEKEVYNHIAPIIESRIAKLAKVRPSMTVLPATGDEDDLSNAKVSKNILKSISNKLDISKLVAQATRWSEICGTVFYKVVWNSSAGAIVGLTPFGENIYEGDVDVMVCSPFEIYPDSNCSADINYCKSLIHAKAFSVDTIEKMWGVKLEGEELDTYALSSVQGNGFVASGFNVSKFQKTKQQNSAMVIERYETPSVKYPKGRLIIIAGNKLVFDGELPYKNLKDEERGFPFIRQISVEQPSLFWGGSVVERMIPVQRAYNAVKNRKHEFINRLSMGVLTVEDGSVDVDELEEDGLSPGKILVYRQGANMPRILPTDSVPANFTEEEQRLENEFITVSGVNDLLGGAGNITSMSGIALQLLIEQEEARISASGEYIMFAIKNIAQQILRLYKQFATTNRMGRIVGPNATSEFFYWDRGDISSDDIAFETESELGQTVAQKRNMILELLNSGLLTDENGKISNSVRSKTMEMLGFGMWEDGLDQNTLQMQKAKRENLDFINNKDCEVLEIHNHDLHISEHVNFMLSGDFEKECENNKLLKEKLLSHIREHKQFKKLEIQANNLIEK